MTNRDSCSLSDLEDEECWNSLEKYRVLLIRTIEPSRIIPYLRQCKVLSTDDEEQIFSDPSLVIRKRRVGVLLDILQRTGSKGYVAFLESIELDYPELYRKITGKEPARAFSMLIDTVGESGLTQFLMSEVTKLQKAVQEEKRRSQELSCSLAAHEDTIKQLQVKDSELRKQQERVRKMKEERNAFSNEAKKLKDENYGLLRELAKQSEEKNTVLMKNRDLQLEVQLVKALGEARSKSYPYGVSLDSGKIPLVQDLDTAAGGILSQRQRQWVQEMPNNTSTENPVLHRNAVFFFAGEALLDRLSESDGEIQQVFQKIENDSDLERFTLEGLHNLWDSITHISLERRKWIKDLDETCISYESKRAARIGNILKAYTVTLEKISYLMPSDVYRFIDKESMMLNQALLANRRAVGKLYVNLMERDLKRELSERRRWKERLQDWKTIKRQAALVKFNNFMSNIQNHEPEAVQRELDLMRKTQELMSERRMKILLSLSDIAPPQCTKSMASEWNSSLSAINEQIDAMHTDYMKRIHSHYENLWQDCLEEVEKFKEDMLSNHVLSQKDIQYIVNNELLQLVGSCQRQREEELEAVEKEFEVLANTTRDQNKALLKFARGAADLWELHSAGLVRKEHLFQNKLDEIRVSHDQENQAKEASLDILMDKLRQESTEETLKSAMEKTFSYLEEIKTSYLHFHQKQVDVVESYPAMVKEELLEYCTAVSGYFNVREIFKQEEESILTSSSTSENLAELVLHRERVDRHCTGVIEGLNNVKSEFVTLRAEQKKLTEGFRKYIYDMEDVFVNATKSEWLASLCDSLHTDLDKHMGIIRASLRQFREKQETTLGKLRDSNAEFIKSEEIRLFSEGGNFTPDEFEVFRKRLDKISGRIDNTEEFVMLELEGMESKCLGQVTKSNYQAESLSSYLEQFRKKIDACAKPSVDKETVTPDELYSFTQMIMEEFKKRSTYLDCLLDLPSASCVPEIPLQGPFAAATRSERQESKVGSQSCNNLLQPSRMGKPATKDAALGVIHSILQTQKSKVYLELEKAPEASGVQLSSLHSPSTTVLGDKKSHTSSINLKTDILLRKASSAGHFKGIVWGILWESNDALLLVAEEFYKKKEKRTITRPEYIQETFENSAEMLNQKLLSYHSQAEEYHNVCLQDFREQLKQFEQQLYHVPPLLIAELTKKHLDQLAETTTQIHHSLHERLQEGINRQEILNQLESLCNLEQERLTEHLTAIDISKKNLQDCVIKHGEDFVTALASLTENMLLKLDDFLTVDDIQTGTAEVTKAKTTTLIRRKKAGLPLEDRVYIPLTQRGSRTWPGILYYESRTKINDEKLTRETASIKTAKTTLGHVSAMEARDSAYQKYQREYEKELARTEEEPEAQRISATHQETRTWPGILYYESRTKINDEKLTRETASIKTAKTTLGHVSAMEARDSAYQKYQREYEKELARTEEEPEAQRISATHQETRWKESVLKIKQLYS
ncbi:UNVERIFIED_CONTAM: hypothetical protein FKN15_040583 [Acipenser sinensis]